MSTEEKEKFSEEGKVELQEHREMKQLSEHNVPLAKFHDARRTIESIKEQVSNTRKL